MSMWSPGAPRWATHLIAMVTEIRNRIGQIVASEQELSDSIDGLIATVEGLVTEFQNLPRNSAGDIPAAHADAFVAKLQAETDRVKNVTSPVAPVDPSAPPVA